MQCAGPQDITIRSGLKDLLQKVKNTLTFTRLGYFEALFDFHVITLCSWSSHMYMYTYEGVVCLFVLTSFCHQLHRDDHVSPLCPYKYSVVLYLLSIVFISEEPDLLWAHLLLCFKMCCILTYGIGMHSIAFIIIILTNSCSEKNNPEII